MNKKIKRLKVRKEKQLRNYKNRLKLSGIKKKLKIYKLK